MLIIRPDLLVISFHYPMSIWVFVNITVNTASMRQTVHIHSPQYSLNIWSYRRFNWKVMVPFIEVKCESFYSRVDLEHLSMCLHSLLITLYNTNCVRRLPIPRPGEVLGLVGTNGIGKSTALKILAGKQKPNLGKFDVSMSSLITGARLPCFCRAHVWSVVATLICMN